MDRVEHLLTGRALDLLIVAMAVAAAAGTVTRAPGSRPEGLLLVGEAVAVAGLVLALLLRRAAPFLAPAGTWLASAGLSFLDGEPPCRWRRWPGSSRRQLPPPSTDRPLGPRPSCSA